MLLIYNYTDFPANRIGGHFSKINWNYHCGYSNSNLFTKISQLTIKIKCTPTIILPAINTPRLGLHSINPEPIEKNISAMRIDIFLPNLSENGPITIEPNAAPIIANEVTSY